jgi:hypothetical protein
MVQGTVVEGPLLSVSGWGPWHGCDAAVSCEVVEHVLDTDGFARALFHALRCALHVCNPIYDCFDIILFHNDIQLR